MKDTQQTWFEKELANHNYSENLGECLRFAKKHHGKNYFSIVREFWSLRRGKGKLTLHDYFLYQLYDDDKHVNDGKSRFISDSLHWPITHKCCDMSWRAITEDKWVCYNFLNRFGIKTPETLAVIDRTHRSFGSDPKIGSPKDLRNFLRNTNSFPVFAKPNSGIGSFGAFVVAGVENDNVLLAQNDPLTSEDVFNEIIGDRTYLLQTFIENHATIKRFSRYVATIRIINLVQSETIITPFAVIKIPSNTSIADNYWRSDNIVANVNLETGVIERAIRGKGIQAEELFEHPETGDRLVGLKLPRWDEVRHVNDVCARLFAPVRYQSLDIALTDEGPVVVEINTGGGFNLPQLASGSGFLTDEVHDFFESCGWKFGGKK